MSSVSTSLHSIQVQQHYSQHSSQDCHEKLLKRTEERGRIWSSGKQLQRLKAAMDTLEKQITKCRRSIIRAWIRAAGRKSSECSAALLRRSAHAFAIPSPFSILRSSSHRNRESDVSTAYSVSVVFGCCQMRMRCCAFCACANASNMHHA